MKRSTLFMLFLPIVCTMINATAQNVSINVLTQNAGLVSVNGNVFAEITIANTSSTTAVPNYKLRPQLSVPVSIVSIPVTGHVLPAGWSIISNASGVIRFSNGTDQVPPNTARTLLIAIQGNVPGGPQTVSGNLLFSNGVAPGSASGPATTGDLTADNSSSSTIEVYDPIPVTLTKFTAVLVNCQPILKWITETEISSDRFEIERNQVNNSDWTSIGTVSANGYSNTKTEYNYIDKNLPVAAERILYRLKIIDKDGLYTYSEILPVFNYCNTARVQVYPNPAQNGRLYISLSGTGGSAEASLTSVSGQVIYKNRMSNGTHYINTSTFADGVYILALTDEKGLDKKVKVIIRY